MGEAKDNPYFILGVSHGADAETVKESYRRLVKQNHPDVSSDKAAANAKMAAINNAYQQLLNDKRASGGTSDQHRSKSEPFAYEDFDDVMAREARRDADTAEEARQRKQREATATKDTASAAREQRVAQKARERAERSCGERPQDTVTIAMNAAQMSDMNKALERRARTEAYRIVTAMRGGIYPDPGSTVSLDPEKIPALHKARRISVDKGQIDVFLGTRGAVGRNFIAMPRINKGPDGSFEISDAMNVFEIPLEKDGKQSQAVSLSGARAGSAGEMRDDPITMTLHFSDERENLKGDILGKSGRIKLR